MCITLRILIHRANLPMTPFLELSPRIDCGVPGAPNHRYRLQRVTNVDATLRPSLELFWDASPSTVSSATIALSKRFTTMSLGSHHPKSEDQSDYILASKNLERQARSRLLKRKKSIRRGDVQPAPLSSVQILAGAAWRCSSNVIPRAPYLGFPNAFAFSTPSDGILKRALIPDPTKPTIKGCSGQSSKGESGTTRPIKGGLVRHPVDGAPDPVLALRNSSKA
ncbi:hypothetical protein NMY22_g8855 [Coprinellus aureogranulatus]|nr:hypothetical protein NMY22_g8855 [Coprinellus aureogranulatus]